MRTRPLVWSLVFILVVAVVGVGVTIATGTTPLLGLDLKGGVSVVEKPTGHVTSSDLQESVQIINRRVNGLGVSNSNVTVQGNNIVIELPGARTTPRCCAWWGKRLSCSSAPSTARSRSTSPPVSSSTTTTTPKSTTTTPAHESPSTPTTNKSAVGPVGRALGLPDAHLASASYPLAAGASTTGTTASPRSTTSTVPRPTPTSVPHPLTSTALGQQILQPERRSAASYNPPHGTSHGVTPAEWDLAGSTVVLPYYAGFQYGRYVLGPAEMSGSIIKSATADLNSQTDQWEVDITFTSRGSTEFNKYAAAHYACYEQDPSNPPYCALQAIELDATVVSAPAIEASSFPGGATINGSTQDPFTQEQASNLALALNYGSLPVRFVPQDISSVSPQIGTDSLKAGAAAGALAVLLVLLYLIIYYRALGLVVVFSICVSGALLYSITTLLS